MSLYFPLICHSPSAFPCLLWPWYFWNSQVSYFVKRPSSYICLMSHDQIEVVYFWPKYRRSEPAWAVTGLKLLMCLITCDVSHCFLRPGLLDFCAISLCCFPWVIKALSCEIYFESMKHLFSSTLCSLILSPLLGFASNDYYCHVLMMICYFFHSTSH